MKILIVGLPGSGKTTQAKKIAENLGFNLILMGEELRNLATKGDALGNKIKKIMQKGELVDDETVAEVIKQALVRADGSNNIVMEGYPRSVSQIRVFDPGFNKVFYLNLSEDEQLKRITDRGRSDDTPQAVKTRIQVQKQGLDGVLNHYRNVAEVVEVDGAKSINEVYEIIKAHLK